MASGHAHNNIAIFQQNKSTATAGLPYVCSPRHCSLAYAFIYPLWHSMMHFSVCNVISLVITWHLPRLCFGKTQARSGNPSLCTKHNARSQEVYIPLSQPQRAALWTGSHNAGCIMTSYQQQLSRLSCESPAWNERLKRNSRSCFACLQQPLPLQQQLLHLQIFLMEMVQLEGRFLATDFVPCPINYPGPSSLHEC